MRSLLVALLLVCPTSLNAQLVRGRVIEVETGQSIAIASLELLDDRGGNVAEVTSDSTGGFRIRAWQAGKFRLRARALGYAQVTSDVLELGTSEEVQITVRLARDAVALEPISVVGQSRRSLKEVALRGYYDRRDAGRRIGMGRFLDRGEVEQRGTKLSDVLRRVAGLRVLHNACGNPLITVSSNPTGTSRLSGSRSDSCSAPSVCPASLYLDGMLLQNDGRVSIDQVIPLDWIEAIEVYRRPAELPAEFLAAGACGVVSIWTRRG